MPQYKQKLNPRTGQFNLVPTNNVLTWKAAVAAQANLPLTGNVLNDARMVNDTQHLYIWTKDAATGLLTDWVDQGDIIDLNWSAIVGKPSSSVTDIDDAVTKRHTQNSDTKLADGTANEVTAANAKDAVDKKHTQNSDLYLGTQVTKVLYVDISRVDTYTENGSITKPYKTIASAIAVATEGTLIKILAGTYNENFTIPYRVSLEGNGASTNATLINGSVDTAASTAVEKRFIKNIFINGNLSINCGMNLYGCRLGRLTINSHATQSSYVIATSCTFDSVAGQVTIANASDDASYFTDCYITGASGYSAVTCSIGALTFLSSIINGSYNNANGLVNISGTGLIVADTTLVTNTSGNVSININSTATFPINAILGVQAMGNIVCGTSVVAIGDIKFYTGVGSLSGSALVLRPASILANDSSIVTGTTVKDALETLNNIKHIEVIIDGNGFVITDGVKTPYKFVPFACTITGWDILASNSDSLSIDILYNATFGSAPASITGAGTKPNLSAAASGSGTTLTGWTATSLAKGGVLAVQVSGTPAAATWAVLRIRVQ